MKKLLKVLPVILVVAVVAVVAVYMTFGPNVFFGGPSKSRIVEAARSAMTASAPSPELRKFAETAKITPKILCNRIDGMYACVVSVQGIDGGEKDFIVEMKRTDGIWTVVP